MIYLQHGTGSVACKTALNVSYSLYSTIEVLLTETLNGRLPLHQDSCSLYPLYSHTFARKTNSKNVSDVSVTR